MTPLFAAFDVLSTSITLLLVIHVIICLLLALVVLMQRPKQEGLGAAFGSGLTDQAFGARTTDVLQKGTVYLGTLFFVVTIVLAILIGKQQSSNPSMAATSADKKEDPAPAPNFPAPAVMPEMPTTAPTPASTETKSTDKVESEESTESTGAALGASVGAVIGSTPVEKADDAPADKNASETPATETTTENQQ